MQIRECARSRVTLRHIKLNRKSRVYFRSLVDAPLSRLREKISRRRFYFSTRRNQIEKIQTRTRIFSHDLCDCGPFNIDFSIVLAKTIRINIIETDEKLLAATLLPDKIRDNINSSSLRTSNILVRHKILWIRFLKRTGLKHISFRRVVILTK